MSGKSSSFRCWYAKTGTLTGGTIRAVTGFGAELSISSLAVRRQANIPAIGGYLLFDAEDLDAAIEPASRIPAASRGGAIEVRPVEER